MASVNNIVTDVLIQVCTDLLLLIHMITWICWSVMFIRQTVLGGKALKLKLDMHKPFTDIITYFLCIGTIDHYSLMLFQ